MQNEAGGRVPRTEPRITVVLPPHIDFAVSPGSADGSRATFAYASSFPATICRFSDGIPI
jgi:hypothetical protein